MNQLGGGIEFGEGGKFHGSSRSTDSASFETLPSVARQDDDFLHVTLNPSSS
jgi:hypothetical protein